jgi:hypothetical protein
MDSLITLFTNPNFAIPGYFCAVVVPVVNVVVGKKYGIPLAVLGFVWLVIAIIMNWH